MTQDDEVQQAKRVGRDLANERALVVFAGKLRKSDSATLCGALKMSFEKGRTEIPGRLVKEELPNHLFRTAETEYLNTTSTILGSVVNGTYRPPGT
ncbi:hypothetical protein [Stenotrophomonas muris]|uniref:hypothetical protein n=1 Tax=Stenotrophomonas muris TaxID=2963283 RepID=UPI003207CA3A